MGEREQAIRGLFDTSGLGLEIGPSYNRAPAVRLTACPRQGLSTMTCVT